MAASTLINSQIVVGSFDATTFTGSFDDAGTINMVESNVYGSGGFPRKYPGLRSYTNAIQGDADYAAGGIAAAFTPALLGTQQLVSIQPTGGTTAGDPSIFTQARLESINAPGGAHGEMATFGMTFVSDSEKIYGQVAAPLAARTSTLTGTALAMTGPTATQRMWAGLHITAVSGTTPTLVAKLQSATLVGFGSPTDRITFTSANAAGWQFAYVSGAITDGFWRAVLTIAGTTPSFTCSLVFGVTNVT